LNCIALTIPFLAVITVTGNAIADAPPSDAHLRGLELELRPGLGSAGGDSPVRFQPGPGVTFPDPPALLQGASPYGAGFIGQASLGYRFHPFVSAGVRGGYGISSASQVPDGSQNLSRTSWDAGFYVRAYPLAGSDSIRRYLDPWVGVGVEYMHDTQSFQRSTPSNAGPVNADWTIDHHAVAVPLGIGIDYRLASMFSVGPSFTYAVAAPVAGCAGASASGFAGSNYCSNSGQGQGFIKANAYGVWSAGIDFRVTLF
jgi:hypothetical protein